MQNFVGYFCHARLCLCSFGRPIHSLRSNKTQIYFYCRLAVSEHSTLERIKGMPLTQRHCQSNARDSDKGQISKHMDRSAKKICNVPENNSPTIWGYNIMSFLCVDRRPIQAFSFLSPPFRPFAVGPNRTWGMQREQVQDNFPQISSNVQAPYL